MLRRKRRPIDQGAKRDLELPPCEEHDPEMPPDLLYIVSRHCITDPRPFQKFAMQLK
jgi:hypothetical protein